METEKSKKLTKLSVVSGVVALILFAATLVVFWGKFMILNLDHKDLYSAGMAFLGIAIWLKLGAIYHKG